MNILLCMRMEAPLKVRFEYFIYAWLASGTPPVIGPDSWANKQTCNKPPNVLVVGFLPKI